MGGLLLMRITELSPEVGAQVVVAAEAVWHRLRCAEEGGQGGREARMEMNSFR